jgi:hypothetical protein
MAQASSGTVSPPPVLDRQQGPLRGGAACLRGDVACQRSDTTI